MRALAGALVCLALPAAANAADYGGGTAPDGIRQADDQLTLIAFRMADDGTGRAEIAVATPCGAIRARPRIGLAADGTFSVDVGRGTEERRTEIAMSGQMVGPVASGTVRATVTVRRRRHVVDKCDSGVREWNVRAAGAVAAPAGAYYGLSSQTLPLVLSVAGSRVRVAAFGYSVDCRRVGTSRPAGGSRPTARSPCASVSSARSARGASGSA
jgi:hypothetical protein